MAIVENAQYIWTVIMAGILHLIHYIKNIEDINQLIAKNILIYHRLKGNETYNT